MFLRSKCRQSVSFVVAAATALHNIAIFKGDTQIDKESIEVSYCDSPLRQHYRRDFRSRNFAIHDCVVDSVQHQERNVSEERRLKKPMFILTHHKQESIGNGFPMDETHYQNPVVLSIRRSGRRNFSKEEASRAEKCIEALESLVSDFRRTFVGLENLQLNSFDVTVSDIGYDDMYTANEELRGTKTDFTTGHTTVRLGNYSHINNKLSANVRAHLMLEYPMYQSTHDLGFEIGNAEQKLLKKQFLELEMYNNVDMLTKNQSSIAGRSTESVLRHELGHAIQYKVLGISNHPEHGCVEGSVGCNVARVEWSNIYNARKEIAQNLSNHIAWRDKLDAKQYFLRSKIGEGVSVYGGYSQLELFAEAWTIYSHPGYGESVKQLPSDIHDFFVKYLPRK